MNDLCYMPTTGVSKSQIWADVLYDILAKEMRNQMAWGQIDIGALRRPPGCPARGGGGE